MEIYKLGALALFIGIAPFCLRAADSGDVDKEVIYILSCNKLDADMEGKTVYMSLYDNNQRLDSAEIKDGTFILNHRCRRMASQASR